MAASFPHFPISSPLPLPMTPQIPRPEYPRPQFVREHWSNLNGEWEFCFDDADQGLHEGWWDGRPLDGRIIVPFPYQCELSGINEKGIHEVVWYARTFAVPDEWLQGDVLLHFGAVDYRATVWLNGREIGHNRGGHVPFSFNIKPYLRDGENRLTLRVEDRQDPRQPRGKQASSGTPHGIDYYCTTGIWQTVWLEPVPRFRIDDLRITPLQDADALQVDVFLHAPAVGWRVAVEVQDGEQIVANAVTDTPVATASLRVRIPEPKRWTPGSPHLYGVRVLLLQEDRILDQVCSYTGLRSIRVENGAMLLNGEPLYLVMVLDQGYWPESYLAAPSDEALRTDVEWVRRFGFNGVRKHQKIEDPRWLYWCDRLGLLVWGEMPNARAWSPEAEEDLLAEWERVVARDYNHPCLVTWVPVNESMGFPDLREGHPGQYSFLERIVAATRRLDSTRPVIDNDGWEHTDITDICAIHDYTHSAAELRARYAHTIESGEVPPVIWTRKREIFARGSGYHGQPVMLTECGGFLMRPELPEEKWDRLYQIYASLTGGEELLERYADLMEGLADLPFLAGFCYTQFTDIEQEINGLLTCDRRPKVEPERIAEVHQRLYSRKGTEIRPLQP
jgi:beta-galactosidase/beta-glucuronidase